MRGAWKALIAVLAIVAVLPALALGDAGSDRADCFSEDNERRISGCSALLSGGRLVPAEESMILAMRALAYSLKGNYTAALADYDSALAINPDFPIALNNRAWAKYKAGRIREGLQDVERALALSPGSPHALDTRAHIRQEMGEASKALADYEQAMRFGGERMIRLYQCGLQAHGLYGGALNGLYSTALRQGLETCVVTRGCDPLPPDEECRKVTS